MKHLLLTTIPAVVLVGGWNEGSGDGDDFGVGVSY